MIGVGITTRKRYKLLETVLEQWMKHSDDLLIYVVVDDLENVDEYMETLEKFPSVEYYITSHRLGIAKAKNKTLSFLRTNGCEHIFLADDDVFPVKEGWWKPWIEDGAPLHQQYILESMYAKLSKFAPLFPYNDRWMVYDDAPGVLLYVHGSVKESFNKAFNIYGFEHIEFNKRVAANNFQPIFVCPIGISDYFYSLDLHLNMMGIPTDIVDTSQGFVSSIHGEDVQAYIKENNAVYLNSK